MRKQFLPFSQPSISEEEIAAVADVLRSGWITTGTNTILFEFAFSCYCEANGSVALTSATAGLHLLLTAMDIGPGDEVITPSMTWVSTVNMIVLAGATPVFVDVDGDTLTITPETIEPLLTDKTRLILPVHFAGGAADMDGIHQLARKRGITVVEDAAHAAGTEYKGQKIGSKGTSIFSFHPIKNMTTGEGGMFCSDDEELLQTIRALKFHGLSVDAHDRNQQGRLPQAEVLQPGFKYNMTDIAAVLGLGQLTRLDHFIDKRTRLAERYLEQLSEIEEILPLTTTKETSRHAWHLFIVRLDTEKAKMDRDVFMDMLKQRNIGTGLHFRAVHEQRYYRTTMPQVTGTLPETEWNSNRICSLPLFPSMTMDDVDNVVATIKEVLAA
ncbi:aminotransferase class I/II-fold pyridoxal phosphate-dependent enzyme [Desulfogranum japonicum]|uniref:aminotransferase class I/II-fold pyridoxal phosphate-dependent enzyme n=1 Tax=Desulfogranum japonicum TaxID=231447 RepID=UPI0003F51914|nr:aminotransferase class I/II-fold pyridoxal phosphate-dependent enzyme [Desulfogranum japonicum]